MNITLPRLALVLLALGLTPPLALAVDSTKEPTPADADHVRLVAARKAAHELPDVMTSEQQAKADRALTQKALAEYKAARKRSTTSEEVYRKAFATALAKVDEGAVAIQEKERVAFRERMEKARKSKPKSAKVTVAKANDHDEEEEDDDEPSAQRAP